MIIKPFDYEGYENVTLVSDNYIDNVMPRCKGNTWKIVLTVFRLNNSIITIEEFQKLTGIKGTSTVIEALQEAVDMEYILRKQKGTSFEYSINQGLV